MIASPDLRLGVIALLAWDSAVERYRKGDTVEDSDVHLRAAGLLLEDGRLDRDWEDALGVAATVHEGLVMVASMGDVVFLSNVYLGRDMTVVARCRAVAENGTVVRMEPVVEIALAPTPERWAALARAVPPPMASAPTGRVDAHPVARPDLPEWVASVEGIVGWEDAPDELRRSAEAALSPDATLAVARGASSVLWFARGGDLFRVTGGEVAQVSGVADELVALSAPSSAE